MKSKNKLFTQSSSETFLSKAHISGSLSHDKWFVISPAPSRIPESKWQEILAEECTYYVANSIREEVLESAICQIYEHYLEREAYAYVVKCSHSAWLQLFEWIDLRYDPGENSMTIAEFWKGDEEEEPLPVDPWSFGNITMSPPVKEISTVATADVCKKVCVAEPIEVKEMENFFDWPFYKSKESLTVTERLSDKDAALEGILKDIQSESTERADEHDEEVSIFTRTITMPIKELLMSHWIKRPHFSDDVRRRKTLKYNAGYIIPAKKIDVGELPPTWVNVDYSITPERRMKKLHPRKTKYKKQEHSKQ